MATPSWLLPGSDLDRLIDALRRDADDVIGPRVVDGVIRMQPIERADDLPIDVTDDQDGATYRVRSGTGASQRRFSYAVGPDSLKAFVHPPRRPEWTTERTADGAVSVTVRPRERTRRAVIGVRSCDLAALGRLDRTQLDGPYPDDAYATDRDGLFLVAVDCSHPATTCFCESVGTGPSVGGGADLALTEIQDDDADTGATVWYLVRAFTDAGLSVVNALDLEPAAPDVVARVESVRRGTHTTGRTLAEDAAVTVLADLSHPRWDEVAGRCLTCGNCTAVCPTCFCTATEERIDLDGVTARRDRVWDTCFSAAYSHLGPGPARSTPMSRYRQWLTHKLGTWHDQFGESGCVGCGRCITWCPVGIDLTAEVEALGAGGAG